MAYVQSSVWIQWARAGWAVFVAWLQRPRVAARCWRRVGDSFSADSVRGGASVLNDRRGTIDQPLGTIGVSHRSRMVNSPGMAAFRSLRGPLRRLSPNRSRCAKVVRQPRSPHPCDPHANLLCPAPKPPRASISHANPHPIPAHTNAQASKWCVPYRFKSHARKIPLSRPRRQVFIGPTGLVPVVKQVEWCGGSTPAQRLPPPSRGRRAAARLSHLRLSGCYPHPAKRQSIPQAGCWSRR
jgi:hypothetical protein